MSDLITRLEALTGPNFEIEQEIGRLMNPNATRLSVFPAYTASIDAALTLRPDPEAWHEIKGPRKYLNIPTSAPNYWSASLESWDHEARAMGWGATPAIALCIAALKAKDLA